MEQSRHRLARLQVVLSVGEKMRPHIVQGAIVPDGCHHIAQGFIARRRIMHMVGRHNIQPQRRRQFHQGSDALFVIGAAVMMQLDKKALVIE